MKKLAAITLCLMMGLFILAGCGGSDAEPSPYAGTWTATTASYSGIEMSVDTLFSEMTFVLENGGKVTMHIDGESETGKWKDSENGFTVEDEFEFVVDGETASMDYDGVTINFQHTAE